MKRLALIGALKLSCYLKDKIAPEHLEKYLYLLDLDAPEKKLKDAQKKLKFSTKNMVDMRIEYVYTLGGSAGAIEQTVLELAALRYMDSRVSDLFDMVAPGCKDGVTIEVAALVNGYSFPLTEHLSELFMAYEALETVLLSQEELTDLLRIPLRMDARLAGFLSGVDTLDIDLKDYCDLVLDEQKPVVYGVEGKLEQFVQRLHAYDKALEQQKRLQEEPLNVILSGGKGTGRYTAVRYLMYSFRMPFFVLEFDFFRKHKNPHLILKKCIRECLLLNCGLCVKDVYRCDDLQVVLRQIREAYNRFGARPLFFTCEADAKLIPLLEGRFMTLSLEKWSARETFELWQGMLSTIPKAKEIDAHRLASKMSLTPGQIKKIVEEIETRYASGEKIVSEKELYHICYQVMDDGRYDNIKRVESGFFLSDLKTSDKNMRILRDICNQVEQRQTVYEEWSMYDKYTYGRCVSVILAGPPGTGKTMAVHALSNELGLELYKVDLSQLVDKYIGETEKRLEEVFNKAQKSNMILFFDEADAIMGKRSEAKDSHDKYANTEIAFILQRMEEYDGIVIMATNYLQNIDSAFMRRIKYVINFELPDEATRMEIWKNSFAKDVPLGVDIDFEFLAKQFELSGGNIKNIVLNATFLAAAQQCPVGMQHIMTAVQRENSKDKRISFADSYGEYYFMVSGN